MDSLNKPDHFALDKRRHYITRRLRLPSSLQASYLFDSRDGDDEEQGKPAGYGTRGGVDDQL